MKRSEFEHIAQQLRLQMLKVALDFFGSKDDAEDAAQEAMAQLWQYCEHINGSRNVTGLAVRVAKNCCVSLHHNRHIHHHGLVASDQRLGLRRYVPRRVPRHRQPALQEKTCLGNHHRENLRNCRDIHT